MDPSALEYTTMSGNRASALTPAHAHAPGVGHTWLDMVQRWPGLGAVAAHALLEVGIIAEYPYWHRCGANFRYYVLDMEKLVALSAVGMLRKEQESA